MEGWRPAIRAAGSLNLSKELEQLKEENQQLHKQVEVSAAALVFSIQTFHLIQHGLQDLQKVNVMSTKNLNKENRSLRNKIKELETTMVDNKEKLELVEMQIKEKDKLLGSYAIYRHKMVHEPELDCKNCRKRAKDEQERQRKELIREKLPKLDRPQHHITSATSIQLNISTPAQEAGKVEYDQVHVRWIEVAGTEWQHLELSPKEGESTVSAVVDNLVTHQQYRFVVCASKEHEEGAVTEFQITVGKPFAFHF